MFFRFATSTTWNYTMWEMKTVSGLGRGTALILDGQFPCECGSQVHTKKTYPNGDKRGIKIMSKVKMRDLLPVVAYHYKVPVKEILGPSRKSVYARPRMIFCWMCRLYLDKTYPEIGAFLNRDHSTCVYAAQKVVAEKWLDHETGDFLMEKAREAA
mgnify:CR=1 FL=1